MIASSRQYYRRGSSPARLESRHDREPSAAPSRGRDAAMLGTSDTRSPATPPPVLPQRPRPSSPYPQAPAPPSRHSLPNRRSRSRTTPRELVPAVRRRCSSTAGSPPRVVMLERVPDQVANARISPVAKGNRQPDETEQLPQPIQP